jgi:hypothetical protein
LRFHSVELQAMFLRDGALVPAVADPRHCDWLSGGTRGSVRTETKNGRPPLSSTTLRICGALSPRPPYAFFAWHTAGTVSTPQDPYA